MHELSITQGIVAMCSEEAGARRVTRVALEIGELSGILPDAVAFCFDVCCKDTVLEGARLDIRRIAGRGRCRECGNEFNLNQPYGQCACGSMCIECVAGGRMLVKEMEVA